MMTAPGTPQSAETTGQDQTLTDKLSALRATLQKVAEDIAATANDIQSAPERWSTDWMLDLMKSSKSLLNARRSGQDEMAAAVEKFAVTAHERAEQAEETATALEEEIQRLQDEVARLSPSDGHAHLRQHPDDTSPPRCADWCQRCRVEREESTVQLLRERLSYWINRWDQAEKRAREYEYDALQLRKQRNEAVRKGAAALRRVEQAEELLDDARAARHAWERIAGIRRHRAKRWKQRAQKSEQELVAMRARYESVVSGGTS